MKAWIERNWEERMNSKGPFERQIMPYYTKFGIPHVIFDEGRAIVHEQHVLPVPAGMLCCGDYDKLYVAITEGEVVPYPGTLTVVQQVKVVDKPDEHTGIAVEETIA